MYIRTKDNAIYKIVNGNVIIGNKEIQIDIRKAIKEGNVVADTIEKLCDEFVYVGTKHNILKYKYMIRNSLCDNDMKYMKMGTEIYGAIWTNKGLIYVAKMNSKGELELI